jgi:propane monooxygenase small subunit
LFHILATDKEHAAHNMALFNGWMKKHAELAAAAANGLQPLWSQPRVKVVSFADAQAQAKNRLEAICGEVGLAVP